MPTFPKIEPFRSPDYIEFIQCKICFCCGTLPPNEAHHVSLSNDGWGTKPPDNQTIPVCGRCHRAIENDPSWVEREGLRIAVYLLQLNAEFINENAVL